MVPFEELYELFFEGKETVMLTLVVDIVQQCGQLRLSERKSTITSLPGKQPVCVLLLLHPGRGRLFDFLKQLADRQCPRQCTGDMDMVLCSANAVGFTAQSMTSTREVRLQARLKRFRYPGLTVLGAEYDV